MSSRRRAPSIIESFNFAFEGVVHVLRTQRNMRIHFAVAAGVLIAALAFDVSRLELIALLLAISFVLIAEMLNSAVEAAVDVASTSFDPLAKLAKDVAAGAVLVAAVNAVAIGYLVFSGEVATRSSEFLDKLSEAPAELTLIALVLTTIVVIALKAASGRGTPLRGGWPSGHAAVAFAGWMAITLVLDDYGHRFLVSSLAFIMALLVAQTRVESGVHSTAEVVVGGVIGALVTLAIFQVFSAPMTITDDELLATGRRRRCERVRAVLTLPRRMRGAHPRRPCRRGLQRRERRLPARSVRRAHAFSRAVAEGYRPGDFLVAATTASPCGGCRQWLAEMGVERVVFRNGGRTVTMTVDELLPEQFDPSDLPGVSVTLEARTRRHEPLPVDRSARILHEGHLHNGVLPG